ncbi:hypothetical protein ACLOJK_004815 [Asimina triloba]
MGQLDSLAVFDVECWEIAFPAHGHAVEIEVAAAVDEFELETVAMMETACPTQIYDDALFNGFGWKGCDGCTKEGETVVDAVVVDGPPSVPLLLPGGAVGGKNGACM